MADFHHSEITRRKASPPNRLQPAANRTAIIEFQVDDVKAVFARLNDELEVVHAQKMILWGNYAAGLPFYSTVRVRIYTRRIYKSNKARRAGMAEVTMNRASLVPPTARANYSFTLM